MLRSLRRADARKSGGIVNQGSGLVSRDDPAFQRVEPRRQAIKRIALGMALLGPGGLQQAQHGVQAVAAGVIHQYVCLLYTSPSPRDS